MCMHSDLQLLLSEYEYCCADGCGGSNTDTYNHQFCNAVGSTPGLCLNLTAAGDICTPSYGKSTAAPA